jgi:hypothetical protein
LGSLRAPAVGCSPGFGLCHHTIDPERWSRLVGSPASGDRSTDRIRYLRRQHRHDRKASDGRDTRVVLREPDEQH